MFDFLLQISCVFLACVGLVQVISWIWVWRGTKNGVVLRVFPLSKENASKQMSAMYTCLQWEAKPARDIFVLCDVGLDEQGVHDCEVLAKSAGVIFIRRDEILDFFIKDSKDCK